MEKSPQSSPGYLIKNADKATIQEQILYVERKYIGNNINISTLINSELFSKKDVTEHTNLVKEIKACSRHDDCGLHIAYNNLYNFHRKKEDCNLMSVSEQELINSVHNDAGLEIAYCTELFSKEDVTEHTNLVEEIKACSLDDDCGLRIAYNTVSKKSRIHWTKTGINTGAKRDSMEEHPVMCAVIRGDLSTVQEILKQVPEEHKIQVLSVIDFNGKNALHYAAMNTRWDRLEKMAVCKFLIENGAIPDTQYRKIWDRCERDANEAAEAAKRAAARKESIGINMEDEPEHWNTTGCDIYGNDYNTASYPVIMEVIKGSLSGVKKKLEKVHPDNIQTVLRKYDISNKYTALHYAAILDKSDICEYLLSIGAENDIKYRNILAKNVDVKQILKNVDSSYSYMSARQYGNR